MTYRRRYFSQAQLAPALDLLLADEGNPRALAFQVLVLLEHIEALPIVPERAFPEEPGYTAGGVFDRVAAMPIYGTHGRNC